MIFSGFGATSPEHGGECSVADFDGKPNGWENWCDCMWPGDRITNAKCKAKPGIAFMAAPWTGPGSELRGIPGPAEWRWVANVLDPLKLFTPKVEEQVTPEQAMQMQALARQQKAATTKKYIIYGTIGAALLLTGVVAVGSVRSRKVKK